MSKVVYCEDEKSFLSDLADHLEEVAKDSEDANLWRSVAGRAYSDVLQFAVGHILSRVNMHIDMTALVAKVNAARHASLSSEQLGALFCTEYDLLVAAMEQKHVDLA